LTRNTNVDPVIVELSKLVLIKFPNCKMKKRKEKKFQILVSGTYSMKIQFILLSHGARPANLSYGSLSGPLLGWESEMGLPPWESEKKLAIISYQDNNNNNIKNKFDIYTFGT
jgi:hypothetical protein